MYGNGSLLMHAGSSNDQEHLRHGPPAAETGTSTVSEVGPGPQSAVSVVEVEVEAELVSPAAYWVCDPGHRLAVPGWS